jgi:hypothetical protein
MLAIADAFDASTVTTLLSVRQMVRAHRRVSKECHTLYRRSRRLEDPEQRARSERHLLEVVADATRTAAVVQQSAVEVLLHAGGIATSHEDHETRRYTSGAVEDTLRWTAVHPTITAGTLRDDPTPT